MKLHIGCGFNKMNGYINADKSPDVRPDVIFDAQEIPFGNETMEEIYMHHVLEHIPDDTRALQECFRVLKKGGTLIINVPSCRNAGGAFLGSIHRHIYSVDTFNYYAANSTRKYYFNFSFSSVKIRLQLDGHKRLFQWLANLNPGFYENNAPTFICPDGIHVELIK